jgi:hypothetical protein
MRTERCPTCKGTGRVKVTTREERRVLFFRNQQAERKRRTDEMQKKHPSWPRLVCQIASSYERCSVRLIEGMYHLSGVSEYGNRERFLVEADYKGSDV